MASEPQMVLRALEEVDVEQTHVEFKTKTASVQAVTEHLKTCANTFDPPLHTHVNIEAYSQKIVDKAVTFEAWDNGQLVGLVAAYFNDLQSKTGYITSVSTLPHYQGRGIAKNLLTTSLEHGKSLGFLKVGLEVSERNTPAINLYSQSGFLVIGRKGATLVMQGSLKNE
jgi:ribosomal protein S18 acetylase RimI-like enzyme